MKPLVPGRSASTRVLETAFQHAQSLALADRDLAPYLPAQREVLVARIHDLAAQGEIDEYRLALGAVSYFRQHLQIAISSARVQQGG